VQLDARPVRPVNHFRRADQRGFLETDQRQPVLFVQGPVQAAWCKN
jgi:hypothetical protein